MRSTDLFLITYASLVFSTVVVLSLIAVVAIDVYIALFVIEFFIASELNASPTSSRRTTVLEVGLVVILTLVVIERVVEILR